MTGIMKRVTATSLSLVKVILILLFIFFNPLVRLFVKYQYLFFTYAGGKKDIRGYGPVFLARLLPSIIPVGYLKKKDGVGRGLMLGTAMNIREFNDPRIINRALSTLVKWEKKTGARAIALGGQLPSVIERNGIELKPPFVRSVFGTVFILDAIVNKIVSDKELDPRILSIGIIGIGFIGSALARHFSGLYREIVAIEKRIDPALVWPDNVTYTESQVHLGSCDIIVILTGRGDDAAEALQHLKPGAIVVDDAHPQLPREFIQGILEAKRGAVFKAVVGLEGVRYVPKLPSFKPYWIPGCAVEVIVATRHGFTYSSQEEFNALAVETGFYPIIETHAFD